MFEDVSESDFPRFLAAFWAEKGWETSVQENDDGTYLVAGDRSDGTRGLIGVRPDEETEIAASEVENFAAFCDRKGVDVRVMATLGRFTTGARSAADAADVHLLDPNELASSVREENAEDLVAEYSGGNGGLLAGLPDLPFAVPTSVPSLPSGVPVVPLAVVVVVVLAAVLAGGSLLAAVPFVGGGGGGGGGAGPAVTALALGDPGNATVTLAWDARTQDVVHTKTGKEYRAPDNETFVVVQFEATATETAVLREDRFALAVNGTNYGVQRLQGATGTLPKQVKAGNTTRIFAVFSVPEDFEGATLLATPGDPGVGFRTAALEFAVE